MRTANRTRFKRSLRGLILSVIVGPLIISLGMLLMSRPQSVSQALLRSGGRIVTRAVERPARTAAISAAVLLAVWTGIGCRCLMECAAEPLPSRESPS